MFKISTTLVAVSVVILLSFTSVYSKSDGPTQKVLSYNYELGGPCGGSHGGSESFSMSWNIATCKTDCQKGLGFRCGRRKLYWCADGTLDLEIIPSSCPETKDRLMEADVLFYDNNTIKFVFKKALPESERGNSSFEVEDGEERVNDIQLPISLFLDGLHYSILRVIPGIYTIDYNDGEFGSVIINARLLE
jgi:hypothetical protein